MVFKQVIKHVGIIRGISRKLLTRGQDPVNGLSFDGNLLYLPVIHRRNELRVGHMVRINGFSRAEVIENGHQHNRDDHP